MPFENRARLRRIPNWLLLTPVSCVLLAASLASGAEVRDSEALLATLRAPKGPVGFCAHLGCGDGAFTAELAAGGRLAVHALEADAKKVERARELLQTRALYGQAAVELWASPFLPYADNLVNVLVAENPGAISQTEMLRVIAPLGTLWVKRAGAWQSIPKPWPNEFDEWTHWRHGADGNMVSRDSAVQRPTGLRWIAGPAQDSAGRKWYYDHVLVSSAGRNFYQYENSLVARDAFNGRLLWSRDAKAYVFRETGVTVGVKFGSRTSKVRPVADGDRLYAPIDGKLVALDGASGQTVQTLGEVEGPRELALVNGKLLVSDKYSIRAFDVRAPAKEDVRPLWQCNDEARRMVAGDGKAFYLNDDKIVCLDLAAGKEQWRAQHPRAEEAGTCSYYRGVLVLERSSWRDDGAGNGLIVFSGENGKLLWTKDYTPSMTHYKESRVFFAGDLLWLESQTTNSKPNLTTWNGLDPLTGEQRKEWNAHGAHCAAPVATEQYLIAPEMEFTDLQTGEQSRGRMVKNACRLPFVPANGLLYTFPVQCECFPMLRGYIGLAQTQPERNPLTPRLQHNSLNPNLNRNRNLNLNLNPAAPASPAPPADDWPIYRHDRYRSGATTAALPDGELKTLWQIQVAAPPTGSLADDWNDDPFVRGPITPPVCASQTIVLAVPDRHRIMALDARTGATRWSYTAGGRVDGPPTITDDRCIFGAHDGYVYCVSLKDGALAWRFRAAPQEDRIAVYGQMESPWPVGASVLVDGGVAYFAAGRHPASDGGVHVCALNVGDGTLLWEKTITDTGVKRWYGGTLPGSQVKVGLDYEPVDLFVRDGDCVAMSRWRFEPNSGKMTLAIASTNYEAFSGLAVPRGLWGYGIRQNKQVRDKRPAVFNAEEITTGSTNEVALLQAGEMLVTATTQGELKIGDRTITLDSPPLHDGLIAARGRLYAATHNGKLYCIGAK